MAWSPPPPRRPCLDTKGSIDPHPTSSALPQGETTPPRRKSRGAIIPTSSSKPFTRPPPLGNENLAILGPIYMPGSNPRIPPTHRRLEGGRTRGIDGTRRRKN